MTIKFFSSVNNYDRAKASIKQSITAFQAGLTAEAYNSDMQVKMALTTFTHAARFLTNAGYVFFNIVNTVYNLGKEKNPGKVLENGGAAIAFHFAAALVDLANVFVTAAITLLRSIVSLVEGYKQEKNLASKTFDDFIRKTEDPSYKNDYQRHQDASALDFSVPILSPDW